jgi:tetratricopeptide (TPR) repeat protein
VNTGSVVKVLERARELERDAGRYPDERGEILLEAACQWERAGEVDQAIALLREVLTLGGEDAQFAHCELAGLYFRTGADSVARQHLQALEQTQPLGQGPVTMAAELLEERGEYEAALAWFDRAVELLDPDELPEPGAMPSLAGGTLRGRQRCRTMLGLPVDEWDRLADIAEDNRRKFSKRLDRFAAAGQAPAASGAAAVEMLVWQRAELQVATQYWPAVFAADVENHHAEVEQRLRGLSAQRDVASISLILGSADGFAGYLTETGADPAEESVRLAYAQRAKGQGLVTSWPPGRNQACWCGSRSKYKKCCGIPTGSDSHRVAR